MILLPAIDLKDGKVVRLYQGSFDTVHQVATDPVETARRFVQAGAKWLHMVDLDGARDGAGKNFPVIREVAARSGLKVEVGGGIKNAAQLTQVLSSGVERCVIGSAAVTDPQLVAWAARQYGARVAVGIDCLGGRVRISGWEKDSGLDGLELARRVQDQGIETIIYTDIATDGTLSGPSFRQLEALQRAVSCRIIASGGVATLDHIRRLRDMGLYGAIVGKAYYAGTLKLEKAVEEAGEQC